MPGDGVKGVSAAAMPVQRTHKLDWLNQVEAGEKIADLEGGGVRSVRAVGAVIADAGAEIVSNGARRSFLRIRRAHGVAPFCDGAVGFEDHSENFPGRHEIGELTKERPCFVDGVEA